MKFAKSTLEKMTAFRNNGFDIIIGNAPFLNKSKKWSNHECVRLARTNSRKTGYSKRTVWAVRAK